MTQTTNTPKRTLYLVQLTVLIAILLLLEVTGLGYIKTPGIEFTIMTVPVIVGAMILGPGAGTVLGTVFGLTSFFQALSGKSPFGAMLLNLNPVGTFITTVPTRVLVGLLCGLIYVALKKHSSHKTLRYTLASLSGALLNTILFMSTLLLFFYNSELLQGFAQQLGTNSPITFVFAFVGVQGLLEALICAVLGTAIAQALARSLKIDN